MIMLWLRDIFNNKYMQSVFANLPTKYGEFVIRVWPGKKGQELISFSTTKLDVGKPVLVRVHSECLTGDAFGSCRCDCESQKIEALKIIHQSGNGVFVYLRQEGRGIGLYDKIKAYKLQEEGYDTYEANLKLGHEADLREYSQVKLILDELGVKKIKLLTNNPLKISKISELGFDCLDRVPLIIKSNKYNKKYLESKKEKLGHIL